MKKRPFIESVIRWLVLIAGYGYLIYRLVHFDGYETLFANTTQHSVGQFVALLLCVGMMVLNYMLEACKWQVLLVGEGTLRFAQAWKEVLYGNIGAFVTPYRAGDIPSRLLQLPESVSRPHALVLGLYGGVIQTVVIVVAGMVPTLLFLERQEWSYLTWLLITGTVAVALVVWLRREPRARWLHLTSKQYLQLFAACTARYLCWIGQLVLVMLFLGIDLTPEMLLLGLPTYYLLVTVTPNMPVADAGIRGSWAVFVLSRYGVEAPLAAAAAIGLWFINTVLPLLLYPLTLKMTQTKAATKP